MVLIALQLIILLFFLAINGEPLRFFFIKRFRLFSGLDLPQVLVLDIYLGGLIFYAIAMLPFGFFTDAPVFFLTALNFVLAVAARFRLFRHVRRATIREFLSTHRMEVFDYVCLGGIFAAFLTVQLLPLSDLVFGSVHDTSLHSLMTEVVLENGCVPLTLKPYLPEGIIYPQGANVIFGFASLILKYDIPKIVFYVTPLFSSLSVFGAYYLAKKIWPYRPFYLGLASVFAFVSSWPLYITWGANPFVVGLPLFLVCLGTLFSIIRSSKTSPVELIIVGLLFGYVGVIIISYLQALIVIAILVIIYETVHKRFSVQGLVGPSLAFLASLLPLSPFLYRFFTFYQYPAHNIGVPSDFTGFPIQQVSISQSLQWAIENLSAYISLRLLLIFLIVIFVIFVWRTRDYKDVKAQAAFALVIFAASSLLSFVAFFLPADFNVISWGHQGMILMIPINIIITVSYIKLARFGRRFRPRLISKIAKNFYLGTFFMITFLSLTTLPFLYYRFVIDPGNLRGSYGTFAVTTQDDYNLMLWMRENLTQNAVILVNPNEAGLFIPSVSHHRIIFPYSGSWFTRSYQSLVSLLQDDTLNETTYDLMQNHTITHVFVASHATYSWVSNFGWNHNLFLGNPNFRLVKSFGSAYLFQVDAVNTNAAFFDDFEHKLWEENGWGTLFVGNGLGNVTIAPDYGFDGSRSLRISAQAVFTASESKYARRVFREIFVLNNSATSLSFYLNATEGFNNRSIFNDTFAVFVSNVYSNQSLIFTTPNGIYGDYVYATQLMNHEGLFSCDLSATWREAFNSSLPNHFILEFVNYDFDGIENVAYVDNVGVTSIPIT